jgi:hypothetical protein
MPSRRLLLALTFSAVVSATPALAQGPDPAAIVKSIYGKRDLYGAAVSLQMRAPHTRALSKPLATLWKRSDDETPAEEEPVPGFDIASNSNDREVARAEVKVERQDATRATVAAKLFSQRAQDEVPGVERHRALRLHPRERPLGDRQRPLDHRPRGMVAQGPADRRVEKGAASEHPQRGLSVRQPALRAEFPRIGETER